jgi:aminodeoxyfutalosine deaminase
MILRARAVVPMNGPPIENGAVAFDDDRIVDVGSFAEVSGRNSGEVVDLGEQALLPGLINAHCHLDYTCLRGKIPPPSSFAEWVRAIVAAKNALLPSDYIRSIEEGFAEARKFGTTTIVNYEAFPELIIRIEPPIRTWWFAELIDVREPHLAEEILASAMNCMVRPIKRGLAPHALYTASFDLYRICQDMARKYDLLLSTHLAESREEYSMFHDGAGPLHDLIEEASGKAKKKRRSTPVAAMLGQIALDRRWLVVHLNELSESDYGLLADTMMDFHIVHCPRSHAYFRHSPFQFDRLREFGLNVCLGTDSLASNDDLSLFAEMRAFAKKFPHASAEEILQMVTVNPARALGQTKRLGQLSPGAHVDLVAVPFTGGNVFEEIIAFEGEAGVLTR